MLNLNKKFLKNKISKFITIFFITFIVVLFIGMLPKIGFLRYYIDGYSVKKNVLSAFTSTIIWSSPKPLAGKLNQYAGNKSITVSPDEDFIILSHYYSKDNYDLFISKEENGKWEKPKKINNINTQYNEITPEISDDGNLLLFASDRGGEDFDIYCSIKEDGKWQKPFQLSSKINSKYDEKYPSLGPESSIFFVSSNRPDGKKDKDVEQNNFDIYSSRVNYNPGATNKHILEFSSLTNRKIINSSSDDLKAVMPRNGNLIYFSSNREGGYGSFDIYESYFIDEKFTSPKNLGNTINTAKNEISPCLFDRGFRLYYSSNAKSWAESNYQIFSSESTRVLSKLNYSLLIQVLLLVLLISLILFFIWYFIRMFQRRSDMRLIVKCLLVALLLHLILAIISSYWYVSSRMSEDLGDRPQNFTMNINSLARENVGLAIREGTASLPKVKSAASSSSSEPQEADVPAQKPVSRSTTAQESWEAETVKETSSSASPVKMKNTESQPKSEAEEQIAEDEAVTNLSPTEKGSSDITMEVPEGKREVAKSSKKGKATKTSGSKEPKMEESKKQELKEVERKEVAAASPQISNIESAEPKVNTLKGKANLNKKFLSTVKPSEEGSAEYKSSGEADKIVDLAKSSGKSNERSGFPKKAGTLQLGSPFTMISSKKDLTKQKTQFGILNRDKNYLEKLKQNLSIDEERDITFGDALKIKSLKKNKYDLGEVNQPLAIALGSGFHEPIGSLVYLFMPYLQFRVDTELELPEEYNKDLPEK